MGLRLPSERIHEFKLSRMSDHTFVPILYHSLFMSASLKDWKN